LDFFATPTVPDRPAGGNATKPSEDLYSVVKRPSDKDTDTPLLMNDPFAELKKNINEMHDQNQMQYQQTPQQQFGHYPIQQLPTGGMGGMSPFQQQHQQQAANPFTTQQQSFAPNPYQQPVIPPRPGPGANPFGTAATQSTNQQGGEFGWTVTKSPTTPKNAPVPVIQPISNGGGGDPFAFLNNQTNGNTPADALPTTNGVMITTSPQFPPASNSSQSASGELLDFLG